MEKQQKNYVALQISAAVLALASKYFISNPDELRTINYFLSEYIISDVVMVGWIIAAIGYILITFYNFKRNLSVMVVTTLFLTAAALFALYKQYFGIGPSYTSFDWCAITVTLLVAAWVTFRRLEKHRERKGLALLFVQILATLLTMFAFTLFGIYGAGYLWAWIVLFLGHLSLIELYRRAERTYFWILFFRVKTKSIFMTTQTISAVIALMKILNINNLI